MGAGAKRRAHHLTAIEPQEAGKLRFAQPKNSSLKSTTALLCMGLFREIEVLFSKNRKSLVPSGKTPLGFCPSVPSLRAERSNPEMHPPKDSWIASLRSQ
ncbi:hypothetical protein [Bradyrhizobium japonicum]|uniref:hypothetical protein n=1 Tax=Bradyrhizobium japonicum TaxID=375 RepID=UPI001B8A5A72|nr:hypothetical protein [Bradyrhizobium japonicum]